RIGSCGAVRDGFELGEIVTATRALGDDGASLALGHEREPRPLDPEISRALVAAGGGREVTTVSSDLF
ncbi:MAG: hypothetical protein QOJ07_3002, partial [Thermoleophilaceae bacterium]|nr:hypothetical protein [Thermoleophilaceae bacterium]